MNARVLVATEAHEGPVHVPDDDALYVTVARGIRRIDLTTLEAVDLDADVVRPNGMFPAGDGRLLVCEQGDAEHPARISIVDPGTGKVESLVEELCGIPLNSPNDVCVGPDGAIWFTDPSYGFLQGFRPPPQLGDVVHRFDPATGSHAVAAHGFGKPNGIALSPDGSTLYVGDSETDRLEAFDVTDGRLGDRRVLAEIRPPFPDGLKVDRTGRVHVTCGTGVQVRNPDGHLLAEVHLPGAVNLCLAEPGHDRLFVTADDAIHVVDLVRGD